MMCFILLALLAGASAIGNESDDQSVNDPMPVNAASDLEVAMMLEIDDIDAVVEALPQYYDGITGAWQDILERDELSAAIQAYRLRPTTTEERNYPHSRTTFARNDAGTDLVQFNIPQITGLPVEVSEFIAEDVGPQYTRDLGLDLDVDTDFELAQNYARNMMLSSRLRCPYPEPEYQRAYDRHGRLHWIPTSERTDDEFEGKTIYCVWFCVPCSKNHEKRWIMGIKGKEKGKGKAKGKADCLGGLCGQPQPFGKGIGKGTNVTMYAYEGPSDSSCS